jgi:hypothetical protein
MMNGKSIGRLLCLTGVLGGTAVVIPCAGGASDSFSWKAGTRDINGVRMNGTEIMKLAPHKGREQASDRPGNGGVQDGSLGEENRAGSIAARRIHGQERRNDFSLESE